MNEKGKKTAVILQIEDYEELLEDIRDLAVIAERRNEPVKKFEEIKKKLKDAELL
jgi:hypothetical protein